MSNYYNPARMTKYCYSKELSEPFKLSRSKIDLFFKCPRCFYLDRVLGTSQPPGFPFALNSAVDHLLKKEFDAYRKLGTKHPLIEKYEVDAIPASHENLDIWRDTFKGIQHHHVPTNLYVFGALDDLWINSKGEYIVVDYKSTSKSEEINSLDKDWQDGYKRQMEVYQWLLRKNGHTVSDTGYFVYCNGRTDKESFDGKLEFDTTLIPYIGNDSWVESILFDIKKCLDAEVLPESGSDCDYCAYFNARKLHEGNK